MNTQFFVREDDPAEGRRATSSGTASTRRASAGRAVAKVAVQIVVNYEEGSEKSFPMGDGVNDGIHEIPFHLEGIRDLCVESVYEYGSRAGIWRLFRLFDGAGVPVTFFAAAVALERNPRWRRSSRRGATRPPGTATAGRTTSR